MQLYALNRDSQIVSAAHAEKHLDYFCPECKLPVRVRGGIHRRDHFFHFQPTQKCRHSSKSLVHLQVQHYLFERLPMKECVLERRFPSINRVADVVWEPAKLIFEVQCSDIFAREVLARNRDYASLGYQVIWLLHDRKYNKHKMSAAENALSDFPHYYTNIDAEGKGYIYDQFSLYKQRIKKYYQKPVIVDVKSHFCFNAKETSVGFPKKIYKRRQTWPVYFAGDLYHRYLNFNDEMEKSLKEAQVQEMVLESKKSWGSVAQEMGYRYFVRPYFLLLQMILEKACR